VRPLQRKEPPDFDRFVKVLRRQGDASYVPFFELCMDDKVFEPLTGLAPPEGLNFVPTAPTYEASFAYFLECCARMGFDHGTINLSGFTGFPARSHGSSEGRAFLASEDGMIQSEEDYEQYPWPSASDIDVEAMQRTARLAPEGLGVMTGADDVFGIMFEILGYTRLSMMLYENPGLFGRVADRIGRTLLEVIDLTMSLDELQGFVLAGDMGFKTGLMVSPEHLRRYTLPWHRLFCEAAHRHGKIIILHSCGNLAEIMPDIAAAGFDGKHSFEDALDPHLFDLHREYGRDICLIGGIDVDFLCRADEAAIRRRVREYIDRMAPDGGYVLGSGNSITDYCPVEHFRAMLDEGLSYGR